MRKILMVLCLFPTCLQAQAVNYTTDVFVHGQGGYPAYRIPSIVTSRKGTLLAFAEGRSSLSDHAENDIVLKRSTDSGRTWGTLQVVAEAGKNNLNNPQAVVLPESGRILMMYQVFPQNYHARTIGKRIKLARPGISGEGVQKCYTTCSDDDGKTWSRPVDVTAQTKRHDTMVAFAGGPGRGIVLERGRFKGRIVMPFNETWYEETVRKFNVYVAYSDDGGRTWRRGRPAPHDQDKPGQSGYGNEVQAVELSDGRIMLNSRSNSGSRCRKVATSSDGGATWSQLADDPQLPEPQCMGSIIRYSWPEDGKSRILFSNPADQSGRKLGTIRMSLDEGRTWPVARVIEDGFYAYSYITVLEDGRIGSLYEADGYRKIRFACFGLDWLAAETNSPNMNVPAPETYDVFVAGAEKVRGEKGKHYAQYREQNVVVTESGRVVVVCQGRNKSRWSDRSGQDLVCKWSADCGKTWSEDVLVVTHGEKSVCPNAAVYDAQTNRIHVLYNLFMWDYTRVPKDIKGELGDLHCRQFVVTSDDEGQTWSKPREITEMVDTKGAVMVVGSGEGIQLKYGPSRGRLLVAGGDFYQGKKVLCYYSDDHGRTWQRSNVVPWEGEMAWASESKVAELPDGTIVLNSRTFVRNGSKQRLRTCAYSRDGGISWTKLQNVPDLKTVSCNGSLIAIDNPNAEKGAVLLCSVPVGPGRTHGTVYASFDSGRTWPLSRVVVAEEFAYSSLALLPDGKIGLFYESKGYESIRLARFTLNWLMR